MTPARREELTRLCEEVTPGPWSPAVVEALWSRLPTRSHGDAEAMLAEREQVRRDAAFICDARAALPDLLTETATQAQEIARLTARWEANAAEAARLLRAWLDSHECECEGGHICGRPAVEQCVTRLERDA